MEAWGWGVVGVIVLGLVWHLARLRVHVAAFEPVRSRGRGPLRHELRRRSFVLGHTNRQGRLALAQAFEQRLVVHRLLGVPLCCRSHQVELPGSIMGMLASLTARDFDADFPSALREANFLSADEQPLAAWPMSPSRD